MNKLRLKLLNYFYHKKFLADCKYHTRNNCFPYSRQMEFLTLKILLYQMFIVLLAEYDKTIEM
jgi:hypothetical protein